MTKLIELDAPPGVRSSKPVVVLDFGNDPFAGPQDVARAADEIVFEIERGNAIVAVLPPYRNGTIDLASLALAVSASPNPRELDLLVSSAALMATALCALAVNRLGRRVLALDGSQAGIITDGVHTRATVIDIDIDRIEQELRRTDGVLVSGSVGMARSTHELTVLDPSGAELISTLAEALGATTRTVTAQ